MKKRIILIPIILILILIVGAITLIILSNKDINEPINIQNFNLNDKAITDAKIENGIELINSKIECIEDSCSVTMSARNNTDKAIDMSEYRISFRDENDEEIYWYSGDSIGIVSAKTESTFSLGIPNTLTDIVKIVYTKNIF